MRVSIERAAEADAPGIAAVHADAADGLTRRFGPRRWSHAMRERGVLGAIRGPTVPVARAEAF